MGPVSLKNNTAITIVALAFISLAILPVQGTGQGTILQIEKSVVEKGETAKLTISLTRAIDGLGRLDAAVVSSKPEVLELSSLEPLAVGSEFFQLDSQKKDRIKFKLVDLRKKVSPGDKEVALFSLTVRGVGTGKSRLNLEDIKYTDEEGNLIEPDLSPAEITVESPAEKENEGTVSAKKDKTETGKSENNSKQSKEETQKSQDEREKVDRAEVNSGDYTPVLEEIEVRLGRKGETRFRINSLPDGLRMAQVWITNPGGITFSGVSFLDPSYHEVVKETDKLVSFRLVDFDNEFNPGAEGLKIADIGIKAINAGESSLLVKRLVVWTDSGNRVVREGPQVPVKVKLASIGRATKPPRDLNGDGLYEDINGDGELTQEDAFIFAFNLDAKYIRESRELFDFNWDGKVSFGDATALVEEIE